MSLMQASGLDGLSGRLARLAAFPPRIPLQRLDSSQGGSSFNSFNNANSGHLSRLDSSRTQDGYYGGIGDPRAPRGAIRTGGGGSSRRPLPPWLQDDSFGHGSDGLIVLGNAARAGGGAVWEEGKGPDPAGPLSKEGSPSIEKSKLIWLPSSPEAA